MLTTLTSPLRVLAFDPGITTGIANGLVLPEGFMEASSFQEVWTTKDLFEYLNKAQPHHVIYERFDFRRRARDKLVLFSRDLIGVIDLYCKLNDTPMYNYRPVDVMSYFTDNQLRDAKLYKPGNPHCNDAMRHLLHWFTFGYGYQFNKEGYRPA